MDKELN